jgi:hypothetical protein
MTLFKNFRTSAKNFGEYCAVKNELRVRKGRKIYRITCGEGELRFAAPARPEVVIPIAPDATVPEFRRLIAYLIDSQ